MTILDRPLSRNPPPKNIKIYRAEDFVPMRRVGQLAAQALDLLTEYVKPGVTTEALDQVLVDFAQQNKARAANLGYRGYPKSICTSVNHVICHGIPNAEPLQEGDILNIDVTLILEGWYGDSSRMYCVGTVSPEAQALVSATYEAMMRGIEAARPGNTTGDIGAAIQTYAEARHYSIVREFCGHGIGRTFHENPNIMHYGRKGQGDVLLPGMFFTIEPMINLGRPEMQILSDGWTAVTRDKSLSAQFEHMVGITETGCEIFTLSPKGYTSPPYENKYENKEEA